MPFEPHPPASPTPLRLVRPALAGVPDEGPGALVALDEAQREAVRRAAAGDERALLVLGAPGTGKTTVALEAVVAAVAAGLDPADVLLLAATRRSAADLRDRLGARLGRTTSRPLVQTPAAAAFAILRRRAAALGEPPPALVSGPEQDVMLAELLAGQVLGEGARVPWPDWVTPQMRALRAFRGELRDLLMRAAERGIGPAGLAELGRAHGRDEWVAAAGLYAEYLDNLALRRTTSDVGDRLDPAVIVDEAAQALAAWDVELPGVDRRGWRLVVVDDHQESTVATARLLRALAGDGARLVLVGDPDAAVQTFRGAAPALVARATAAGGGPGELGAGQVVLRTVWRGGPALRAVVGRITEGIGTLGAFAHRQAVPAGADEAAEPVRVAIVPNGAQEAAFVAHALRDAHLNDGVPWGRMAVVARSGAVVTALRRALAGAGVPVSVAGSDVPLRDEPAVQPLLLATAVAVGAVELDAEVAVRLATSPLGGLDAVALRRVRRALRADELASGGGRSSDALLVEVLGEPARAAGLPRTLGRPVAHLARILAAGRQAAAEPDADAQGVLWAVWQAAGLAETWRRRALAGGVGGDRADRDLDAVLALFRAAETFVDRMPRSAPSAFVDWIAAQDLPADTIAAHARREAVAVLTPAGAAGQEWDLVVVAGVQEGVWPDVRLRDSLLGAQALVDLLAGRAPQAGVDVAARAGVLADELRAFAVACSRARRRLLVTAVGDADVQPSPLLDLVVPPDDERDQRVTAAPAPLDLRGLVARLRAALEASAATGEPDATAARVLARLAAEGVAGAHPDEWAGLAPPSSDAPLWGPDERVPVSPSKIETFGRCGLRWALESAGGTPASGSSQNLGSLIHSIAQEHPQGTREELAAALEARWRELGLTPGWQETRERRRADEMVRRLAGYVASHRAALVEAWVEVEIGRAVLRGSIDRVEATDDGRVVVVDLKTGKTKPSIEEAKVHPQLGAYQLAIDAGGLDGQPPIAPGTTSAGARLVYVSDGVDALTRDQPGLDTGPDGASWARELVERTADEMARSTFAATVNDLCDRCPVRRSCPVLDEGGQVVA